MNKEPADRHAYQSGEIPVSEVVQATHLHSSLPAVNQERRTHLIREEGPRYHQTRIDALTASIQQIVGNDVLVVGQAPPGSLVAWSFRTSNDIVITAERIAHARDRHPEIVGREKTILETLLDPDEVHVSRNRENVAIFYRSVNEAHDIVVPVWVSREPDKQNSMQTAYIARKRIRRRGEHRDEVVWRKG